MRSFTPKIIALSALLVAAPFASAYAARGHDDVNNLPPPAVLKAPRIESITGQVQGIKSGVADALQARQITPAEAHRLDMRANNIERSAEKVAMADHDRIPAGSYRMLERRLDRLDQQLNDFNGTGFDHGGTRG